MIFANRGVTKPFKENTMYDYDPLFDFEYMKRRLDELMKNGGKSIASATSAITKTDGQAIYKVEREATDDKVSFKFIVPGVPVEDIQVWTENGLLYVKAKDDQRCFALDQFNSTTKKLNKEPASIKLALGILTVEFSFNVDEASKRRDYKIDSVD